MRHATALLLAVVGSLTSLPAVAAGKPADVLRKVAESPFEVPPQRLLAAAQKHADAIATQGPVPARILLLDQTRWSLDAEGRLAQSVHQVVYVHAEAAVSSMSGIGISWSPWLEDAPELRARVVAPDGSERWLREDEVAIGSPRQGSDGLYTTDKTLEAPLPGVRSGVVVEQAYTRNPSRALSPVASAFTWMSDRAEPVLLSRLVIDTPTGIELRSTLPDGAPAAQTTRKADRNQHVWERTEVRALEVPDVVSVDFELPIWRFSAGGTWADLARSYGERVAPQQDPTGIDALVARFSSVKDRQDRIAAALDTVRTEVRYTGLEFGESAIVPYKPAEALLRGYGDCKDQANLLVVGLEQVGIPARLALVDATGIDGARPEHPGLEVFDHVIVYLPEDDIWIDPTFPPAAIGTLPLALRGRNALIIHPETIGLTPIPETQSSENTYREVRTVHYTAGRPATFSEEMTATGFIAHDLSMAHGRTPRTPTSGPLVAYAASEYGTESIKVTVQPSSAKQPSFRLQLSGIADRRVAWDGAIAVRPVYSAVFEPLPPVVFVEPSAQWRAPGVIEVPPYQAQLDFVVDVPVGFAPSTPPTSATVQLGDATVQWTPSWNADTHQLAATLRFDTGDGRFTPDELDILRGWALHGVDAFATIELDDPARELITQRRSIEAIAHYDRLIQADPTAAWPWSRKAQALVDLGMGTAAHSAAEQATSLSPDNPFAWFDRGFVMMHDAFGRQLGQDADRAGSIAAYERVVELGGPTDIAMHNIALLHDLDRDGLGRRTDPAAAADAYTRWLQTADVEAVPASALWSLLAADRLDQVRTLTEDVRDEAAMTARLEAIARSEGIQAMLTEARRRSATRELEAQRLSHVRAALLDSREYDLFAALLEARPDLVSDPMKAESLRTFFESLTPFESGLSTATHPEHALAAFMVACLQGVDTIAGSGTVLEGADGVDDSWSEFCRGMNIPLSQVDVPVGFVVDNVLASGRADREGTDDIGYRIRWDLSGASTIEGFVVREKRQWTLAAISVAPHLVGERVLHLNKKGQVEAAAQWSAWLQSLEVPGQRKGSGSGYARLAQALDMAGIDAPTRDVLVAAAAAPASKAGQRALSKHGPDAAERAPDAVHAVLEVALGQLARDQAFDPWVALATAQWVQETLPEDARTALSDRVRFYREPTQALAALPPASDRTPRDWRNAAALHQRLGSYPEAAAAFRAIDPEHRSPNNLAWAMLLAEEPAETVVELLRDRATSGQELSSAELHTLATALADADQPEAARHTFLRYLEQNPTPRVADLSEEWWYVVARMAESYGALDVARAAYLRVPDSLALHDVFVLCQRRLARLPNR